VAGESSEQGAHSSGKGPEAADSPPATPHPVHVHHPHVGFRFFEELKRRNVVRVGLLYFVVCWLILDPIHVVFHMLEVPTWANRLVVVLMVFGFPAVLLFAWVYEVTPEGLKPVSAVDPQQSITRQTGRRLDVAIVAALVLGIAYLLIDKLWLPRTNAASDRVSASTFQSSTRALAPERSIAVLPFLNMSEDKSNEYFSDGLSEELTDLLARTPELRVAARTSAFYFKGKQSTISDIGKALGVGNVLEGSVRKSGNTLRITAQLVQTSNGYHLWSDTYDRMVDDVFKTQDEIAGAVARALQVQLLSEPLPGRTENFDAYNLVLQGRFFGRTGEGQKALDAYRRAVELDPHYALAWAYVSYEQTAGDWRQADGQWHLPDSHARETAERAIALDPNLADGYVALALFHAWYAFDWTAAQKALEHALALDPQGIWAISIKAEVETTLGHSEEGIELGRKTLQLDPFYVQQFSGLGESLRYVGRLSEAEAMDRRALALAPGYEYSRFELGLALLEQGKIDAAIAELQQTSEGSPFRVGLVLAYFAADRKADSDNALAQFTKAHAQDSPGSISMAHAYRNEREEAFKWLAVAYERHDSSIADLKVSELWNSLHGDPRYQDWLRKLNLAP
jgi:adenylate cyclase